MRGIIVVVIVFLAIDCVFGKCGTCGSKSGVVCRDRTSFSFCRDDNNVDYERFTCPSETICGNDYRICAPDPEEACNPACGNCTSRYACLSENTYALCFGQGYPSGHVYTCPDDKLCSTQKATGLNFCYNKMSLENDEIDCFKDIVVKIRDSDGGAVLLPPALTSENS